MAQPAPTDDLRARLKQAAAIGDDLARLDELRAIAAATSGHLETIQIDRLLGRIPPEAARTRLAPLRIAVLSSATVAHLLPGLRVAALRHGFLADVKAGGYGQYRHELLGPDPDLVRFAPEVVVLSLSARSLVDRVRGDADAAQVDGLIDAEIAELQGLWEAARTRFGAHVLQQTCLDVFEPLFGSFDRLAPSAPARIVERLNQRLAEAAQGAGVALLDVARASAREGLAAWFDPARWLQGKMEIAPEAAARYGELALRVVAAQRGRSRKCLVFDLDNTLWGGVVGDVGLEGLVLGEGSAAGEAHLELQRYGRRLKERGIILAVCSKNELAIAERAFTQHPEMALKRTDIACFVANWRDKAENLADIARQLNIGLDSLVFVDDNPAERARVRAALPMVAVPELPEDPAGYVRAVASQGYFEAVAFTAEDASRAEAYAANAQREALRGSAQSVDDFLRGLDMVVAHGPIGAVELERSTQLINKTNQFNTTGRRHAVDEVTRIAGDARNLTLQFRLADRLGDNGLVSVMLLRAGDADDTLEIDTWVMSCRVFGRGLEHEAANIAVELAAARGVRTLTARLVPTDRNGVVTELYPSLGFEPVAGGEPGGTTTWRLDVDRYEPRKTFIRRGGAST